MAATVIPTRFRLRRDLAANWTAKNPTPLDGEPCLETDTGLRKLGDGSTEWNSLLYQLSGAAYDFANLADGDTPIWDAAARRWKHGPGGKIYQAGTGIDITDADSAAPTISSTLGSIALSGYPDTYADLPNGLNTVDAGNAYMLQSDGLIYIWDGSAFPASGHGLALSQGFHPLSLFPGATCGCWIDFTDLSMMFQDTAGTVPVTEAGQSIALIKDKSGFAFDAVQTAAAKRPTLTQDEDGVYCALFASGDYFTLGKATNAEPLLVAACARTTVGALNRVIDNRGAGPAGSIAGTYLRTWSNVGDFALIDDGAGKFLLTGGNLELLAKGVIGFYYSHTLLFPKAFDLDYTPSTTALGSVVNANNNTIGVAIDGVTQPFVGSLYQVYAVGGKSLSSHALNQVLGYLSDRCKA